jgi:hypothetical protein
VNSTSVTGVGASTSNSVPRNTSSKLPPPSVLTTACEPVGEIRTMSRSWQDVWRISRYSSTSAIDVPAPETTSESKVVALSASGKAGERVNVFELTVGAVASALSCSDQDPTLPAFEKASSCTRNVHVPLGSSPRKAARRPSGESGLAVTRFW